MTASERRPPQNGDTEGAGDGAGRIWLIGSMGAGKTAVGRALAGLLEVPLLDNDDELHRLSGRTTAELAGSGDDLHGLEAEQLAAAASRPPPFVAGVAASVADRPGDLALLNRTGLVVYLRVPADVLAKRVMAGPERPWLDEAPEQWLRTHLERRDPAYVRTADLVVDAGADAPEGLAGQIVRALHLAPKA